MMVRTDFLRIRRQKKKRKDKGSHGLDGRFYIVIQVATFHKKKEREKVEGYRVAKRT